jgi:hypothetical protein
VRGQQRPLPQIANVPEKVQECFALLVDSVLALQRENKEILWGSMVKETMKRKKPSFNETYYGFRTFSHLLEDAQRRGIVTLRRDQRSGSYIVEDLGAASTSTAAARMEAPTAGTLPRPAEAPTAFAAAAPAAEAAEASNGARNPRRRRGRGRRARGASTLAAGAFMDPAAPTHPDDADGEEGDEHDEGEETLSPEEHEHGPRGEAGNAPPPHPEAAPGPGPAPAPAPGPAEPERPSFSLFSWIRRDQTEPPPPHPPEVRKPESRD